jgi:phosphopantothenoylcysteine decarboxylase/phosphopantothenate--cysteine ligase
VPTAAALRFVGAPTWAALSGQPVATEVWDDVHEVPHVRIGQEADLVVVAPGHRRPARQGRPRPRRRPAHQHAAHRPLPGRVRARRCTPRCGSTRPPAPTSRPCAARRVVIEPAVGRLTGADTGKGRLPDPAEIFERRALLLRAGAAPTSPAGTSSSPPAAPASRSTRCASSATARPASRATPSPGRRARGAEVTLIAANVTLPDPAGVDVVRVGTTEELRDAVSPPRGTPTSW